MKRPSKITFATCLFAAPLIFGAVLWLFGLGGEYLARFGQAGALALIVTLPAWFTAFAILAWRSAKAGKATTRDFVFLSLGANVASLVIYPVIVGLASLTGTYQRAIQSAASLATDESGPPPEPLEAAFFAGGVVFFLGLFFMPMLAGLFALVARKLGFAQYE